MPTHIIGSLLSSTGMLLWKSRLSAFGLVIVNELLLDIMTYNAMVIGSGTAKVQFKAYL